MFSRLSKTILMVVLIVAGGFLLTQIKVPSNKDAKNLTALLSTEGNVDEILGVYFWDWDNSLLGSGNLVNRGKTLLENVGTSNVRITMSPKSDIDYHIGTGACIPNFSLKNLASRDDFRAILADPQFKTVMITAYDGVSFSDCATKNYLNPDFYTSANIQKIKQEYSDFARYLANFSGKTFIVSNWEGDGDVYNYPESRETLLRNLEGYKQWFMARYDGIHSAGAANVFSAIEFGGTRSFNLSDTSHPDILRNVIPFVTADFYSYSSYMSVTDAGGISDDGSRLRSDVGLIRNILSGVGQNPNNLIIGEVGFSVGNREEIKNKLVSVVNVLQELDIRYFFIWNLLDVGGPFGLYDSRAELTPAGAYICDLLDGRACENIQGSSLKPRLSLDNISVFNRNPNFYNIDSWSLKIRGGQPNQTVRICGIQNGGAESCTPAADLGFGASPQTDSNGSWTLENSWAGFDKVALNGNWTEWAYAGDQKTENIVLFNVSSAPITGNVLYVPEENRSVSVLNGDTVSLRALFGANSDYSKKLEAEGGQPPYQWEIIRGELPAGFSLSSDGEIKGETNSSLFDIFSGKAFAFDWRGIGTRVTDSSNPPLQAVADIRILQSLYARAAEGLVPCGGTGQNPCTTCDLFVFASGIINFILFTITPAVAVLLYLMAGFMILLGGADPGLVATGKNIFKTTTYGLFIIFGAWMITNTLLKSLAGEGPFTGEWNKVTCTGTGGVGGTPTPTPTPSRSATPTPTPTAISNEDLRLGQPLARDLLALGINFSTSGDCGAGFNASRNIQDISAGRFPAVCNASCSCTAGGPNGNISVNWRILDGLKSLYTQMRDTYGTSFRVTSFTTGRHSSSSSHYTGEGVDIVITSSNPQHWQEARALLDGLGGNAICEKKSDSSDDPACSLSNINHIHWTLRR